MAIDIFSIQPSVISRDLSGKSFFIYGDKKSGKTSNAVKFPKPILVAFEKGYNMLSGVMAQPVNKWKEALDVKKQLLKDAKAVENGEKAETVFKTVIVDTADLAYDMCEAYILAKEGVEYLDETESKRGYKAVEREFDTYFQEIVNGMRTVNCKITIDGHGSGPRLLNLLGNMFGYPLSCHSERLCLEESQP